MISEQRLFTDSDEDQISFTYVSYSFTLSGELDGTGRKGAHVNLGLNQLLDSDSPEHIQAIAEASGSGVEAVKLAKRCQK